jgi:DNA-binding NtrC family response regulator
MNSKIKTDSLRSASVALCGCDPDELAPLATLVEEMGYAVHRIETLEQLNPLLDGKKVDAILVHVCPSRQEFLPILGREGLPPVIPLLRHADQHLYLQLLRRGAFDCVQLPSQKDELERVLSLAMGNSRKQMAAKSAA